MTSDRELMQQALHTLEGWANVDDWVWPDTAKEQAKRNTVDAITALRERLAQPEQEPVAWYDPQVMKEDRGISWTPGRFHTAPLYTAPPQRQPLTDEEADELVRRFARYELLRAVEAAHNIKENT